MSDILRNCFLFSHLYLERLCQDASEETGATNLVADLRAWVDDWDDSSLSSLISTQIEPTLVGLDFHYEQSSDDPCLLRLYSTCRRERPIGLCYVAYLRGDYDRLDSTVKGCHYAAKIIHAVREEELRWGLLTDGKHWRLYHADELAPCETYLEIDLGQLLQGEEKKAPEEAALLFYLLFRESAFTPDEEGECALDRHLSRSEEATEDIKEHLSECIENVLRNLCQGFIERDGHDTYTAKQRDDIFRNATILLYRMLFILYAEARELLPLGDPAYTPVSLDSLVKQAIDYTRGSGMPDPDATSLWQKLLGLCSWIDSGDDERHIPCYNGDLFDDSDKRYIHRYTVADKYLAKALFSLGCIETNTPKGYRRIDYRDLSVRHLGSIYEGLLEYKLFIAQERRVKRSDGKGGFIFPKLSETTLKKGEEDNVISVGQVYFAHNAGQRKAMGAYYTPEYIVDYIVKQTVRRGLEERRQELEEKLPGWLEEVRTAALSERKRLQQFVDQKLVEFVNEKVLTFRVCDPAMGSGHFLVNAAHTITDFIVDTLNLTPWENAEIDSNPVTWRRKVAKRCLYGVDLNPLAVELAKLSLWLTTVAQGKPLSFLDHHLRCGNSLIGARLEDLEAALGGKEEPAEKESGEAVQLSMLKELGFQEQVGEAVDILSGISDRLADEQGDVADQALDYKKAREVLAPYWQLADLLTAQYCSESPQIVEHVVEQEGQQSQLRVSIRSELLTMARNKRLFHWELEFPEVFIDLERGDWKQNPGFDAMVGNPPFGAEFTANEQQFVENRFSKVKSYTKNSAMYFAQLSMDLTAENAYVGLLSPKSICYSEGWYPCAKLVADDLDQMIDVTKAFLNVLLEQVFFIVRKAIPQSKKYMAGQMHSDGISELYPVPISFFENTRTLLVGASLEEFQIYQKVAASSLSISEISTTRRGLNWQRRASRPEGTIPIYRGAQLDRYFLQPAQDFVNLKEDEKEVNYLRQPKVMCQTAPAHVLYPRPHLYLQCVLDEQGVLTFDTVENTFISHPEYEPAFILSWFNSRLFAWLLHRFVYCQAVRSMRFDDPYVGKMPIRRISFITPKDKREKRALKWARQYERYLANRNEASVLALVEECLAADPEEVDVVHDLLTYLAKRMLHFYKRRHKLDKQADLFWFVEHGLPFIRLDEAFVLDESRRADEEMDLAAVHHDIDGLRVTPNENGTWTLELQAKFRDPEQEWQEWIKEEDGRRIKRQWVPAYRLAMNEQKARFYRYALPRLQDFDNACSFPGGRTRSTLKKLHLTRVPIPPNVDLSELARLDRELTDTQRKIELTDDLIDQIVYKLYGLTEEEIAIVEGRA